MSKLKDYYAMSDDELEKSFDKARRTHDRIEKWGLRGAVAGSALAVAAGIAGIFTCGVTTAVSIFSIGLVSAWSPLGLLSMKRDDCAMDMQSMISAKRCRIQIGEAQQQRAAQESLRRMQDQFNDIAQGKGLDSDLRVKGPLSLKSRKPSFMRV